MRFETSVVLFALSALAGASDSGHKNLMTPAHHPHFMHSRGHRHLMTPAHRPHFMHSRAHRHLMTPAHHRQFMHSQRVKAHPVNSDALKPMAMSATGAKTRDWLKTQASLAELVNDVTMSKKDGEFLWQSTVEVFG